jgi:hypothetical protein
MNKILADEHAQLSAIFTEWERTYRDDPNGFMSEAERLVTPCQSFGDQCATYFLVVREALTKK